MGPGWRTEDWDSDYLVQNILDLTQIFLASWLAQHTRTFNTLAEESSACWITSQWTWISPARDIDVVTRVPQFLRFYVNDQTPIFSILLQILMTLKILKNVVMVVNFLILWSHSFHWIYNFWNPLFVDGFVNNLKFWRSVSISKLSSSCYPGRGLRDCSQHIMTSWSLLQSPVWRPTAIKIRWYCTLCTDEPRSPESIRVIIIWKCWEEPLTPGQVAAVSCEGGGQQPC